jgi:hypothetical protein
MAKRKPRHQVSSIVLGSLATGICITRTGTLYSLFIDGVYRDELDALDTRECVETLQRRGVELMQKAA